MPKTTEKTDQRHVRVDALVMPQTVRVRIAVAVDPSGSWSASGWHSSGYPSQEKEAMDLVVDDVDAGEARFWIEAELPIPRIATVEGQHSAA